VQKGKSLKYIILRYFPNYQHFIKLSNDAAQVPVSILEIYSGSIFTRKITK
jgi:hypothetical protein